jgi:hypothetical protein
MSEQPAEESLTADAADLQRWVGRELLRWTGCCSGERPIPEPLVRAVFIKKADIRLADVVDMAQAEAREVFQALSLQSADPSLRERVRVWRQERRPQAADSSVTEQATECNRELAVAVVDIRLPRS